MDKGGIQIGNWAPGSWISFPFDYDTKGHTVISETQTTPQKMLEEGAIFEFFGTLHRFGNYQTC
jgi:hypothetical protein